MLFVCECIHSLHDGEKQCFLDILLNMSTHFLSEYAGQFANWRGLSKDVGIASTGRRPAATLL